MIDVHSRFVIVGLPDEPLPGFNAMSLLGNGVVLGGSHVDSEKKCIQMLQLAANKGVKPWITQLPMSDAKKAVEAVNMNDLKGKYRFMLTQELKEAEK
jgi:alcohol dehydrogenase (NADP+)